MSTSISSEYREALALKERHITDEQLKTFEGYAREIFSALGMDEESESTTDTPKRFIKALFEATEGYDGDDNLIKTFEAECHVPASCPLSQIIQGPIPFHSLCEHHVLPFYGNVYVGYIAKSHIIGLSKLTRLVNLFSRRFGVQERIGVQIADLLEESIHPDGIAVYIEAHHMCMEMRGVREREPLTRTSVWRGSYAHDSSLRAEFLTQCGVHEHERR